MRAPAAILSTAPSHRRRFTGPAAVPVGRSLADLLTSCVCALMAALTAAVRHLWDNPNPSATIAAWPMQHPVLAAVLWSLALLVVATPLAMAIFRWRMTE